MKKIWITVLAVCLLSASVAAVPASAEDDLGSAAEEVVEIVDLSPFTDDDLVALLGQVQAEIAARNIEKSAQIQPGTYVGGQDIPAGKYQIARDMSSETHGYVEFYSADDNPAEDWPSKLYEYVMSEEEFSAFITVEDGDMLIVNFPCSLTISAGLMFQ